MTSAATDATKRARLMAEQDAWETHRKACLVCAEAWENREATDCATGDEIVSRMDHAAIEAATATDG